MKLYVFRSITYKQYSDWADAYVVASSEDEARRLVKESYENEEDFKPDSLAKEPEAYEIGEICESREYWG